MSTQSNSIGISKKISGVERTRLRVIAKTLQPKGYGLTVRTVAAGHALEELQKDLEGLLSTWKAIIEHAKSAALAADEGVEGAIPVLLHKALGQTLSVVQDYFNEKVNCSSSLILPFAVSAVVIYIIKSFLQHCISTSCLLSCLMVFFGLTFSRLNAWLSILHEHIMRYLTLTK